MKKVLCVGSAVMDILVQSSDFRVMKNHQVSGGVALCEVYGGKTEAQNISLQTGGAGINVAVALARLGLVTSTLARVGDDWMKDLVLNDLKSEGVDVSMVQIGRGEKTGMSVVLVASDGGRSIITYRGAAKDTNSGEIDWGKISGADWVQISALGGNMALAEDLVSFARKGKVLVGWNPGKGELLQKDRVLRILPKIDLLILNRMEAAQLVRHSYEEMKEMALKISSFGVKKVVITDGKRGAGVMTEGVWISAPAFKTKSVDDTGAGDAFTAGMVAGILAEKEISVCLKMGLANGASEVTDLGAKTGLLRKNEMTKWLRRRLKIAEERSVN
jgi:ribokinase